MAKKNTNKAYEPFKIVPPGVCPQCFRDTLIHLQSERSWSFLDEDGVDRAAEEVFLEHTFICTSCGFSTHSYIDTDKGWRYSPTGDDEYIRKMNENPSIHNWKKNILKNPFTNGEIEITEF